MAAGLGFKDFVTGEVLTAADVDGYLMQGVWVFASATARDAAVTSPQEGNFAYLKDTNVTTYYTGSAWANLDTTGMTNPMTTTGDTIYSSSGSTPARLGIGTAGQVLTVNSGATAPEWKTATSGGMTLISTTTLTGSSVTLSSIPSGYNSLQLRILNYIPATDNTKLSMRINSDSNTRYSWAVGANAADETFVSFNYIEISNGNDNSVGYGLNIIDIPDYASTTRWKTGEAYGMNTNATTTTNFNTNNYRFYYNQLAAITSLDIFPASGNFTSGSALLYGVK
jgi:hypothetical protein